VDELPQAVLHLWYEDPGHATPTPAPSPPSARVTVSAGRADISALPLPSDVTTYLCGPLPFMRTLRGALLGRGLKPQTMHYEVFGPDLWLGQS
ncbi:hemin transporter, partial [Streptomyces noursei]